MVITNVLGSVVRNISYVANGTTINVGELPRGIYYASTYGKSITFYKN
jgi:hypothetical protein